MNLGLALLLAFAAAGLWVAVGYLVGVRRGRSARDGLRAELLSATAARSSGEKELLQTRALLDEARAQLVAHPGAVASAEPIKDQIDGAVKALLQPLLARDLHTRELHDAINGLLGPMVERERLGLELTRLDASLKGNVGLSQLLSTMARRAGFSTVLVTDNNGLPMGQNEGAQHVEVLGASLGLLLTMVDRIAANGAPAPLAVVMRDAENHIAVHRMFKVEGQRYVLTAITSGSFLSPDTLDPTLARIERVLTTKSLG
jgi:hypothetical protein